MAVYPIGFWNFHTSDATPLSEIALWKGMGTTLTLSPHFNVEKHDAAHMMALLDEAHAQGIQVVLCDDRTLWNTLTDKGEAAYIEACEAVRAQFCDHPAVWGIYIGDEPDYKQYEDACTACRLAKDIFPGKEIYLNLLPRYAGVEDRVGFIDYGDYLDDFLAKSKMNFLTYDCYSQMNNGKSGWNMYFHNLKTYSDAAKRNNVPFWTIVLSGSHYSYRIPSLVDLRWQLNTSAAHGAQGIWWFTLHHLNYGEGANRCPLNSKGEPSPLYADLCEAQSDFNAVFAPILPKLKLTKVQHVHETYGGYDYFSGDTLCKGIETPKPAILSYFTHEDTGDTYIMVTNNSFEGSEFYLTVRGDDWKVYGIYGERESQLKRADYGSPLKQENGLTVIYSHLAAGGAVLYRLGK